MRCGRCNKFLQGKCCITGNANGYLDECDITERQKLIYLLSGLCLDTYDDVEYVADYLLQNGVFVL